MKNCFIILAAGKSERFNSSIPKAYTVYKGKPVVQHSIDKAKKDLGYDPQDDSGPEYTGRLLEEQLERDKTEFKKHPYDEQK